MELKDIDRKKFSELYYNVQFALVGSTVNRTIAARRDDKLQAKVEKATKKLHSNEHLQAVGGYLTDHLEKELADVGDDVKDGLMTLVAAVTTPSDKAAIESLTDLSEQVKQQRGV